MQATFEVFITSLTSRFVWCARHAPVSVTPESVSYREQGVWVVNMACWKEKLPTYLVQQSPSFDITGSTVWYKMEVDVFLIRYFGKLFYLFLHVQCYLFACFSRIRYLYLVDFTFKWFIYDQPIDVATNWRRELAFSYLGYKIIITVLLVCRARPAICYQSDTVSSPDERINFSLGIVMNCPQNRTRSFVGFQNRHAGPQLLAVLYEVRIIQESPSNITCVM